MGATGKVLPSVQTRASIWVTLKKSRGELEGVSLRRGERSRGPSQGTVLPSSRLAAPFYFFLPSILPSQVPVPQGC